MSAEVGEVEEVDLKAGSKSEKQFWLNSWQDHLAQIKAFSSCVELSDVNGDGDYKLLVADAQRRLKVFSGTSLVTETPIMSVPSAIVSFYMDYDDEVRRPNVAVSSGPFIFVYKNLRPFYKFTMPPVELPTVDVDTWNLLKDDKMPIEVAVKALEDAKDQGANLSTRSLDLLAQENDADRFKFVEDLKNVPLVQQTVITAMTVLLKDKEEATAIGCLVVGTETGFIFILDRHAAAISKKLHLPSTPAIIIAAGLFDVEYRVITACINGCIYLIKNGTLQGAVIEPDSMTVGLTRYENLLAVGTMSNSLTYFHLKGKRHSTVYMSCAITNVTSMTNDTTRQAKAVVVALCTGEIRVYAGKSLLNKTQVYEPITAMKFGRYGREDATLVLVLKSGTIMLKMLPRTACIEPNAGLSQGPPAEQDIPLKVPKRTNLYVEQTDREKQFGVDMHRVFQRDLCRLRLNTARAYVKMLTDGQGTMSHTSNNSIRLTAHVQGLGPLFKIKLSMQNTGVKALCGVQVCFSCNQETYRLPKPYLTISTLVPSLIYNFEISVECIDEHAATDVIRVIVGSPSSRVPIITAIVNMPVADFLTSR